jgi:formate dehydrogenase iron-sulfur subunit
MDITRRQLLKLATAGLVLATRSSAAENDDDAEQVGVLVDTTLCIGCRKCEEACYRSNGLPRPARSFSDRTVLRSPRRPTDQAFTVVNEYPGPPSPEQALEESTYIKIQCMHCLDPACVSACIVGALTKATDGAVVYRPEICIGCRYCLLSCPFEILAYEFDDALTPRVRKCELCTDRRRGTGANPACAAACPTEALVFGRREELLALARSRIAARPARYRPHIYGEHEAGGTAWLYLTGRDFEELDLLDLPEQAPPRMTEVIQHTVYRYGAIPLAVYGALGCTMWLNRRRQRRLEEQEAEAGSSGEGEPPQTPRGRA